MPMVKRTLLLAAASATLLCATAAYAGTNVAMCVALSNNYNQCMREQARGGGGYGGGWGGGYEGGYGGGWGGGYDDGYGGWGGGYDNGYRNYRRGHAQAKQAECARWLVALQQNNCVPH